MTFVAEAPSVSGHGVVVASARRFFAATPRPGARVVCLGATSPALASALAAEIPTGRVLVCEPDRALLERSVAGPRIEGRSFSAHCVCATNLRLEPQRVDAALRAASREQRSDYLALRELVSSTEQECPLIADASVDLLVVDLLANRYNAETWESILAEAFRILRREGKLVVSARCADEPAGEASARGGLGAQRYPLELELLTSIQVAGFHGIEVSNDALPEADRFGRADLRTFVVDAYKGKAGVCLDQGDAVIFKGRGPRSKTTMATSSGGVNVRPSAPKPMRC